MSIEENFDVGFVSKLTSEEKQIQQNYRPIIGVHKWFARRPGALFRSLVLSEFATRPLREVYFRPNDLSGVIVGDPFMGGGTSLFEANRVGCNVVGFDSNPMAYWIVRQELGRLDRRSFREHAGAVIADVESSLSGYYETTCVHCEQSAPVKYFLWVKHLDCSACGAGVDLFPGYLVAGNSRHTHHVLSCPACKQLTQLLDLPDQGGDVACEHCGYEFDWTSGSALRNRYTCFECGHVGSYPHETRDAGPPRHRLFGIEYHCPGCSPTHRGRFFRTADEDDIARFKRAAREFEKIPDLDIPDDEVPDGDETRRLHRWGYHRYRDMFNERQLLSLGLLMRRIREVDDVPSRHALATVFSDILRYQNLLCRYDTHALKCQDIFSVHGYPVGLIQCENNVLGIPHVGSGSFAHFVEKYDRAKEYCEAPFETIRHASGRKTRFAIHGEVIKATLAKTPIGLTRPRRALLHAGVASAKRLSPGLLDGVFTDPPYFNNVQYAELMDFCYVWLRRLLHEDVAEFAPPTTRTLDELTGNKTTGKGLEHFTAGLSVVFSEMAEALKPGGPFVFTYHHNDPEAYVPIVVAILDAGLVCTATLPAVAEMSASLHINGTGSSVVDTVVVCRPYGKHVPVPGRIEDDLSALLTADAVGLASGGHTATKGDLMCLAMGHIARAVISHLRPRWTRNRPTAEKMAEASVELRSRSDDADILSIVERVRTTPVTLPDLLPFGELS